MVSGGSSSQLDISARTTESSSSTPMSLHSASVPGDGPRTQPTDGARYPHSTRCRGQSAGHRCDASIVDESDSCGFTGRRRRRKLRPQQVRQSPTATVHRTTAGP